MGNKSKPKRLHRRLCTKCHVKHIKPTGKNCMRMSNLMADVNATEEEGAIGLAAGGTEAPANGEKQLSLTVDNRVPMPPGNIIHIDPPPKRTPPPPPPPEVPASNEDVIKLLIAQTNMLQQTLLQQQTLAARPPAPAPTQASNGGAEMESLVLLMTKLTEKVDALDSKVNNTKTTTAPTPSQEDEEDEAEVTARELRRRMDELLDVGATTQGTVKPVTTLTPYDDDEKKKGKQLRSGRELRAENEVVVGVPWPHLRVYRFPEMKGADYDGLSVAEFMYGYVLQMDEAKDPLVKAEMFKHLVTLLEDAKDYPDDWPRIRAFHSLVLAYIERGLMAWNDRVEIMTMRQKYVFALSKGRAITSGSSTSQATPCPDYNNGNCSRKRDHDQLKHICAYCHSQFNKHHLHPKVDCMKLHGQQKQLTNTTRGQKALPKQTDDSG